MLHLRTGKLQAASNAADDAIFDQKEQIRRLEICMGLCDGTKAADRICEQHSIIAQTRAQLRNKVSYIDASLPYKLPPLFRYSKRVISA